MKFKIVNMGIILSFLLALLSCNEKVLESPSPDGTQAKNPSLKSASLNYYVATTGKDSNPGTLAAPFQTIGKAIGEYGVAKSGDRVYVRAGTYNEKITIIGRGGNEGNPTILQNYNNETVIIDGTGLTSGTNYFFIIYDDYITIRGLEFSGGTLGAILSNGDNVTIDSCYVHDIMAGGILARGNYNSVLNCTVVNVNMYNEDGGGGWTWSNSIGVGDINGSYYPNHCIIKGNTVHDGWGEGISTYGSNDIIIEDNVAYDNWACNIYVCNATNVIVQRNFVYQTKSMKGGSQIGLLMGDENIGHPTCSYITFKNNIVYGCKRNFHRFAEVPANLNHLYIYNNTFVNSVANDYNANIVINGDANNSEVYIKNNIVAQDGTIAPIYLTSNTGITFSNNLWSKSHIAGATGSGDIIGNPNLLDIAHPFVPASYQLKSTSPAINAGANIGLTSDFMKNVIVGVPDIGAFKYQGQEVLPSPSTVYYNAQISATATKSDCGTGFTGSTVTYTIPANKYSSTVSQLDADSKAVADLTANKQTFANANGACTAVPSTIYYNIQQSGTATKSDCGAGYIGSTVTYTVAAKRYSSTVSQADADNKAIADVASGKQVFANANGTCTAVAATVYYNVQQSGTATKNTCGTGYTGSTVTYTVAAGKYSSTVSQADADSKAIADVVANKQTYANTNGTCIAVTSTPTTPTKRSWRNWWRR